MQPLAAVVPGAKHLGRNRPKAEDFFGSSAGSSSAENFVLGFALSVFFLTNGPPLHS